MKVKKFEALNMSDALEQIRKELGDEAVILNSKVKHTRGWFGIFKKKKLEVIAALDTEFKQTKLVMKEKNRVSPHLSLHTKKEESNHNMQEDLSELKRMVQEITITNSIQLQNFPEPIQIFCEGLKKQEVSEDILYFLSSALLKEWRNSPVEPSMKQINDWGKNYLVEILSEVQHGGINIQKKYVNLVGPTGVGKTTTLAKIAAGEKLEKNKKIAFITTDTYRIAAIEQLKTYANLLNVPVEVVYKLEDFQKAIKKFDDFDHIFIDTAGRNYREIKYIEELQKLIDFKQNIETYLTLSMTMKENDLEEIIKNFESISINKFIFTKLDETTTYGTIINLVKHWKKGVAYLTYGQDVPDDLDEGSPTIIVEHLFAGMKK
ncbi:flagellar biosynthesis protein FlhF [Heyndrickxia sp. NPDC080065]|uniref:flagellar biosynthesis protein FlhF n=1 Tax=Heyndrickxia sp. NPDC080065 TaxID=3390568 RepID=UPI003D040C0F